MYEIYHFYHIYYTEGSRAVTNDSTSYWVHALQCMLLYVHLIQYLGNCFVLTLFRGLERKWFALIHSEGHPIMWTYCSSTLQSTSPQTIIQKVRSQYNKDHSIPHVVFRLKMNKDQGFHTPKNIHYLFYKNLQFKMNWFLTVRFYSILHNFCIYCV